MATFITQRLTLRPFALSDLFDFYQFARDPLVGPNAGWRTHENSIQSLKVLQAYAAREDVWAVVERSTGKVMGSVDLHKDDARTLPAVRALGYALGSAYWGKGYMSEAVPAVLRYGFITLGLEMVSVYHYPGNMRSKRVIEKMGFKYEGVLRHAYRLPDGSVTDHVCYSMLREEYAKIAGAALDERV